MDRVEEVLIVLHDIACPCRIPIHLGAIGCCNLNLVLLAGRDARFSVLFSGNCYREYPKLVFLRVQFITIPEIEVTKNREGLSRRCPFAIHNVAVLLDKEPEFLVRLSHGE